jgi:hypothetical protein
MFLGYAVYRSSYPEASRHTLIAFGGTNAAVLLISSTTMAFAVWAAREIRRWHLVLFLLLTASLGCLFLVIKGLEYSKEISEHFFARFFVSCRGCAARERRDVFLHLLADDRRSRAPRRHRNVAHFNLRGACLLHQRLHEPRHAVGSAGPLLAFCRYRLGLFISVTLSCRSALMNTNASPARIYILNGVALLGLLGLTIVTSYVNLGVLNSIVTASISVASLASLK